MSEEGIQAAYVKAWQSIHQPKLDGKNPRFGNRYATIASMQAVIRDACAGSGIAYRQRITPTESGYRLVSDVVSGGEAMPLSGYPVTLTADDQANGKTLTYAKRQQAGADWGIAGEEDDDGNANHDAEAKRKPKPKAKPDQKAELKRLWAIAGELKVEAVGVGIHEDGISSWMQANVGADMTRYTPEDVHQVIEHLRQMIADAREVDLAPAEEPEE